MTQRPMPIANVLGLSGLLPFFACAAAATMPGAYRDIALLALLAYGACILSFLGAVHWGFVLTPHREAPPAQATARLALGTLPSLIAWIALMLGFTGQPLGGIGLILAGVLATVAMEAKWTRNLLVPLAYFKLRVVLSTLVGLTLAAVLAARILGIDV